MKDSLKNSFTVRESLPRVAAAEVSKCAAEHGIKE